VSATVLPAKGGRDGSQGEPGGHCREVKDRFADDEHVCVIGKLNSQWSGNDYLRGAEKPFSTYQCMVYRIVDGRVTEVTSSINWLDAYVQVGLVDPSSFLR
jgi:hypothetical protein